MLGNISDYLEEIYKTTDYISCFAKDIEKLYKKSPYCSIIFAYLYDIENKKQRSNIDTPHYQKDLINFLNAESAIFTSAISLQKKDKILYIKGEQSLMEDSKSYNAGSEIYENFSQAEDFPGKVLQELIPITTGKTILDI
jgi:hypothetical protein